MALEALVVALQQGTVCTEATFEDQTVYTDENVPAQRFEIENIYPAATSGKTNIPLVFTSGATTVVLNVAILTNDTVHEKCDKIVAAINANGTLAALVTASRTDGRAVVTGDIADRLFNFTSEVDTGSDLPCTIEQILPSTRTLTFEYSTGATETVDFPYVSGTGDAYTLTGLAKDYAIKTTMTIVPQREEVGSNYVSIIYPVFACNALVAKNAIASDYVVNMQEILCANPKLDTMSAIDANINASIYAASAGNLASAQALLDQANAISN